MGARLNINCPDLANKYLRVYVTHVHMYLSNPDKIVIEFSPEEMEHAVPGVQCQYRWML